MRVVLIEALVCTETGDWMLCTSKVWVRGVPHTSQGSERVPRLHACEVVRPERGALAPPCLWVGCTSCAGVRESCPVSLGWPRPRWSSRCGRRGTLLRG